MGLDVHIADRVDPALQQLAVGDLVRLVPEGPRLALRFVVARLEAPYNLVLGPDGSRATTLADHPPWPCSTFRLTPLEEDTCRLVVSRCTS